MFHSLAFYCILGILPTFVLLALSGDLFAACFSVGVLFFLGFFFSLLGGLQ